MTFNGENYLKNRAINAQRFNLEKKLYVSIGASWIAIVLVVAKHFIRILKTLQDLPIVFYIEPWVFLSSYACLIHSFLDKLFCMI